MRLVAVPVDQDDVAGLDQRLHDDLVGGRGAVGDEVGLPRAERLGRELLRLAQRPGGLEQRVQAAAGRRRLGQEDFQAVEVDHVPDPVGVDDRLAVRDRQRVEHPGGPVAVVTQRAEERRTIPGRNAVQDGQVQLERPFPGMEDAPEMVAEPAGQVLDGDLRHQVQVEFGPDLGQRSGEFLSAVIRRMLHQVVRSVDARELCEQGRVVAGPVGEPAADHARLQPEVQPRGHNRLVEAGHHDDLVDELVIRAAPPPQLFPQRVLLLLGQVLDDENLEIRPVTAELLRRAGIAIVGVIFGAQIPGLTAAVGLGDQGPVGPAHHRGEPVVLTGGEEPLHLPEDLRAGKRPESLDRPEDIQQPGHRLGQLLDGTLLGAGQGQLSGRFLQAGPGIVPELPQAVVRQRLDTDRHGNHLRDLRRRTGILASRLTGRMPLAGACEQEHIGISCPGSRFPATGTATSSGSRRRIRPSDAAVAAMGRGLLGRGAEATT